jgi:hypothetical protein
MTSLGQLTQGRHAAKKDRRLEISNPARLNGRLRALNEFRRMESEKYPGGEFQSVRVVAGADGGEILR